MRLIKARALAILLTFLKRESTDKIADFLEVRIDGETVEIVYGSGRSDQIAFTLHGDIWHVLCALYFRRVCSAP